MNKPTDDKKFIIKVAGVLGAGLIICTAVIILFTTHGLNSVSKHLQTGITQTEGESQHNIEAAYQQVILPKDVTLDKKVFDPGNVLGIGTDSITYTYSVSDEGTVDAIGNALLQQNFAGNFATNQESTEFIGHSRSAPALYLDVQMHDTKVLIKATL